MRQNNWLTYYPTWISSYPTLWLQWQRTVFGNWFNIWTKATPTAINGMETTLTLQEQVIKNFLEIEEKSIHQSLEMQKMYWQNYFKLAGLQKNQIQDQAEKITKSLEPFPTSAKLSN